MSLIGSTTIQIQSEYRVPTLPGKPGILSFTFPCLENAWNLLKKCENPGMLTQSLEKTWNFVNFMFQDSHFKMSFTKNYYIQLCHIYMIRTNTDSKSNWPGISLTLPGNNLENTWNFVSPEKWEPWNTVKL